uniref:Uncharacterized protein n=1 Tax=Oryza sativa subsp. japonica TaxID=39947 RepID=Q6AUD3_ORYSJ|nr:hypothetical protein [Oryza sativa Japonica Group]
MRSGDQSIKTDDDDDGDGDVCMLHRRC